MPMQRLMIDAVWIMNPAQARIPSQAIAGWLRLQAFCTIETNGGLIPKAWTDRDWQRILPDDCEQADLVAADLLTDDGGDHWALVGYDVDSEATYLKQKAAGLAEKKRHREAKLEAKLTGKSTHRRGHPPRSPSGVTPGGGPDRIGPDSTVSKGAVQFSSSPTNGRRGGTPADDVHTLGEDVYVVPVGTVPAGKRGGR